MDKSKIVISVDPAGETKDLSVMTTWKKNEDTGKMEIISSESEIVELEAEEVSDYQLNLERIVDGIKPHFIHHIPKMGNKNMSWEEFENLTLYNETEEENE